VIFFSTTLVYRKDTKENHPREEIDSLIAEMRSECMSYEFEIEQIKTRQLRRKASRLNLPLLSTSNREIWERTVLGDTALTEIGRHEVEKAIRQEKGERREGFIQYTTVIIGLIGVLIGLIAMLKS